VSRRGFAPESIGTSAVLIGAVALGPISTDLYLPSVPWIGRDLGADVAATQLTLSVFLAAFAIAQIPVGPVSDRFGRRPVLLIGLAVYVLASAACAFAPSIDTLILARALQATGACAGVVLGRAVVRDIYGRDRAARMLAYIGSAMALAPMIGPILGGVVQSAFGWRWNFGILTTFGLAALVLAWRGLAESNAQRDPSALDPARMAANFGTLLRHRGFVGFALAVAFSYAGLFAFISGSSFVLIDALGVATEHFGFFFAMGVIGYIAGTQLAGRLTMRMGIARMIWLGGTISVAGGVAMVALTPLASGAAWAPFAVAVPMACYMIGTGIVMPNAQAGALGPFAQMAGAASSLMGFLQMAIAAAVGVAFGQIHDGTPLPMALLVAASGCCSLASFAMLARRLS
jgi:DHA1 family bicyclomycin/chloramphenicol resistance-like MFS transporter